MNAGFDKDPRLGSAGSVIFDEISELDAACQRNLLYALPDGMATRRRGTLEARVISTTSRNLDDEMRAGRFRSELYYRINGVCLRCLPCAIAKKIFRFSSNFFLGSTLRNLDARVPR